MRTLDAMPPAKRRTHRARDARHLRADREPARACTRSSSSSRSWVSGRCIRSATASSKRALQARAAATRSSSCGKIADNAARRRSTKAGVKATRRRRARSISTASTRRCARKRAPLGEIVDVYGLRIVVDSVDTCYRALGHRACGCTSRCRAASRTTSRSRASTATSRCTRRCSGRTACRSRCRSAPRTWTASPSAASRRTGNTRPVDKHRRHPERSRARMAAAAHGDAAGRQLRGVPRERQGRPVPRQGLRVHAEGRNPAAAARRDGAWTSPTRCTRTSATAASRPRSTGALVPLRTPLRNGQTVEIITAKGADAESGVGEFRRHREGARCRSATTSRA